MKAHLKQRNEDAIHYVTIHKIQSGYAELFEMFWQLEKQRTRVDTADLLIKPSVFLM